MCILCSSTMQHCYQCLILALLSCTVFQDSSGVTSVNRSAQVTLRDPGTYIIQFQDNSTDAKLQHFMEKLIERSCNRTNFKVEIITRFFSFHLLIAKLSERALKWVRSFEQYFSLATQQCILTYFSFIGMIE